MKFRITLTVLFAGLALSACNFTLAADITPPPDYVAPTPIATLGPLSPAEPPDLKNGAAIFAENCLPCHGVQGLGDGPQSQQLPVPVAALGLPEVARKSSPAEWYAVVSQGNLERFMPPFTSLTDQERWDVVYYAFSLHTDADQIEQGRELFESNCANCSTALFTDPERMAALSDDDLVDLIKAGNDQLLAFGGTLSEDGQYAVAAYLRSLTPLAAEATAVPTAVVEAGEGATPTVAPDPAAGGTVDGAVENLSGRLPAGLTIRLRAFDHGADASGPQEVLSIETSVLDDGSFAFEGVDLPEGRILLAEATHQGVTYQSDLAVVEAGMQHVTLAPLEIYDSTDDFTQLTFEQVHIAFDFAPANTVQVFEIFTFANETDRAVLIRTDGTSVPFILLPEGAQDAGFEAGQDTNQFLAAEDGIVVLPGQASYSLIAFFTLPYDPQRTQVDQPFAIQAESALLFLPQGIRLQSGQWTETGVQQIASTEFVTYRAQDIQPGEVLTFILSGRPADEGSTGFLGLDLSLIFGAGALGLALIGLAVWMYVHDRVRPEGAEGEDAFQNREELMDSIIALDDLHRAGKVPDDAYKARRAQLKEKLKRS
jgi:mono/diheme cytochrome c family protein